VVSWVPLGKGAKLCGFLLWEQYEALTGVQGTLNSVILLYQPVRRNS